MDFLHKAAAHITKELLNNAPKENIFSAKVKANKMNKDTLNKSFTQMTVAEMKTHLGEVIHYSYYPMIDFWKLHYQYRVFV